MPSIDLYTDGRIHATSDIREAELIKLVPGTRWDKEARQWTATLSWATCIAFRGVFGLNLEVGPALTQWAEEERRLRIDPATTMRTAMEEPALMESEPELFPFQRVGVRFLESTGRALIADDMGSGKTVQLIRAVDRLGPEALPVLVVCPNSMKYTWKEEVERWSDLTAAVVDGTAAQRKKAISANEDFTIINWESLRLHTNLAPYGSINLTDAEKKSKEMNDVDWGTVIADEAHRAKDPKSKQTRALWAVSRAAKYRFAATGTPIESNPAELWPIMNFISPDDFPVKTKYIDRYCLTSFNHFGGMDIVGLRPETSSEFHAIIDPKMLRRPKDVILPQLPPKIETLRLIPFAAGKQKKAYDDMAKHMLAEMDDGSVLVATSPITQFVRLSQFASAYAEVNEDGAVRLSLPSNKADAFLDLIEEAGSESVVGFAESSQLINLIAEKLKVAGISHGLITGDFSVPERQAVMGQFQAGNIQVLLGTAAAAEGITLTRARILVFIQRFWSSIKNAQAADRIHRIGQTADQVEIITFATKDTVDEHRELVLEQKGVALQEILKDDDIRRDMLKWGKRRNKA